MGRRASLRHKGAVLYRQPDWLEPYCLITGCLVCSRHELLPDIRLLAECRFEHSVCAPFRSTSLGNAVTAWFAIVKNHSYRISWITFTLALVSIGLIPIVVYLTDDGVPGWDQLPETLGVLVIGLVAAVVLFFVSFVSGMYTWRRRKIALLWVVPSGLITLYVFAILVLLLVGPHWNPRWL